jgi:micrococcal nuclease
MSHTYRRRPAHWVTLAVILAVLAFIGRAAQRVFVDRGDASTSLAPPPAVKAGEVELERVVDGDTLIIRAPASLVDDEAIAFGEEHEQQRFRVRLSCVDAPESVKPDSPVEPFGPEASQFTKKFLAGQKLRLEFGRRRIDQYDRVLAFVFVEDRLLNEELVRAGLARAKIYPGDEGPLATRIEKAQRAARADRVGIWSRADR